MKQKFIGKVIVCSSGKYYTRHRDVIIDFQSSVQKEWSGAFAADTREECTEMCLEFLEKFKFDTIFGGVNNIPVGDSAERSAEANNLLEWAVSDIRKNREDRVHFGIGETSIDFEVFKANYFECV